MRKLANIFLIFLLLFSTTGVVISKHYCGEILQAIVLHDDTKSCCDSQEMPEDCCSDDVSVAKIDEIQLSHLNVDLSFSPYILYYTAFSLFEFSSEQLDETKFIAFFESPPIPDQEIFVLDQSFLL